MSAKRALTIIAAASLFMQPSIAMARATGAPSQSSSASWAAFALLSGNTSAAAYCAASASAVSAAQAMPQGQVSSPLASRGCVLPVMDGAVLPGAPVGGTPVGAAPAGVAGGVMGQALPAALPGVLPAATPFAIAGLSPLALGLGAVLAAGGLYFVAKGVGGKKDNSPT